MNDIIKLFLLRDLVELALRVSTDILSAEKNFDRKMIVESSEVSAEICMVGNIFLANIS